VKHPPTAASPGCPNGGPPPARRRQAPTHARRQQGCAWHQSARASRLPQVRPQAHRARKRDHPPEPERAPEDRCPRAIPAPAVKPCRAPFPASVSGPLVTLHRYRSPDREGAAARAQDLVSPAGCRARHPPAPRPRAPGRPSPTPAAWPAAPAASTPYRRHSPSGRAPSATARLRQPALFDGHQSYRPAPVPMAGISPATSGPRRLAPPRQPTRAPTCTARAPQPSATGGPADRPQPSNQRSPAANALHRRAHPWAIGTPPADTGHRPTQPTNQPPAAGTAHRPAPPSNQRTPAANALHPRPPHGQSACPRPAPPHRPPPPPTSRQLSAPPHRRARATGASGLLSRPRHGAGPGGLFVLPPAWPTWLLPSGGHRRSA